MIQPAVIADMIRQSRERKPTPNPVSENVSLPQPRRSTNEVRDASTAASTGV